MRNGYPPQDLANTNEISWHEEVLFSKINCSAIWDQKDKQFEGLDIRNLDAESSKLDWAKERETDNSENFSMCISFGDKIPKKNRNTKYSS